MESQKPDFRKSFSIRVIILFMYELKSTFSQQMQT
jgi:hypothetical protein